MTFYDGSASSIGILVVIILLGTPLFLMILGCIIVRCNCNCNNVFWPKSKAQELITKSVNRKRLRHAAHRGGSINARENTLGAFKHAVANQAGMLELDLCLSKDGIPLVFHDSHSLERVIDPDWLKAHPECEKIQDCNAADPSQLPPLAARIPLHFPSRTHSHFDEKKNQKRKEDENRKEKEEEEEEEEKKEGENEKKKRDDEKEKEEEKEEFASPTLSSSTSTSTSPQDNRVCTFEEFLSYAPLNVCLHVDIKEPNPKLVKAVIELIARHPRTAPTLILGAGGTKNYHQLVRRLHRNRGCCGCGGGDEEKNEKLIADQCDEFSCCGCALCCCCCCCCENHDSLNNQQNSNENNNNKRKVFTPSNPSSSTNEPANTSSSSSSATAASGGNTNNNSKPLLVSAEETDRLVYDRLSSDPSRRPLIFASFQMVALTYLCYYFGLLPYIPLSYDVFSVPAPVSSIMEVFGFYLGKCACLGNFVKAPALFSYLRSRGIVVTLWVVNNATCLEEACEFEVDSIMTDDVEMMNKYYEEHPEVLCFSDSVNEKKAKD